MSGMAVVLRTMGRGGAKIEERVAGGREGIGQGVVVSSYSWARLRKGGEGGDYTSILRIPEVFSVVFSPSVARATSCCPSSSNTLRVSSSTVSYAVFCCCCCCCCLPVFCLSCCSPCPAILSFLLHVLFALSPIFFLLEMK